MDSFVILSDLHLGRPRGAARSASSLRPLWRGFDHVVINGDAAEIHHPRHRADAAREVLALLDLCAADGVDVTLLSGNHDPFITDRRHLELAGGRVFVTHGDAVHPAIAPWSPAVARIRAARDHAMRTLAPAARSDLELRLSASQLASFAEWTDLQKLETEASKSTVLGMLLRPRAVFDVLHYWRVFPGLAAAFAAEHAPEARFVVLGHSHRPGIWDVGGRRIINTGSFGFPGHPRAVAIRNGTLSVRRIRRRRDAYVYDERLVAEFPTRA